MPESHATHDHDEHEHEPDHDEHDEHGHPHGHGHPHEHDHHHAPPANAGRAFMLGVIVNFGFVVVGVIAGIVGNSTALLADAAHNLGDVLGLAMAWGAMVLARRGRTARRTYGLRRGTIVAALANAMLLLVAVGGVTWESIQRFGQPHAVDGGLVAAVAVLGVIINTSSAMLFLRGRKGDVNVRGAFLHLIADAAVSAGVVVAGLVIWRTGWTWLDPATSLAVSAVILVGTWGLLRESMDLIMDAVPAHIEPAAVEAFLRARPGVCEVHDLHIWSMSTTEVALTAHLVVAWAAQAPAFMPTLSDELRARFGIGHATVQLEPMDASSPCAAALDGAV